MLESYTLKVKNMEATTDSQPVEQVESVTTTPNLLELQTKVEVLEADHFDNPLWKKAKDILTEYNRRRSIIAFDTDERRQEELQEKLDEEDYLSTVHEILAELESEVVAVSQNEEFSISRNQLGNESSTPEIITPEDKAETAVETKADRNEQLQQVLSDSLGERRTAVMEAASSDTRERAKRMGVVLASALFEPAASAQADQSPEGDTTLGEESVPAVEATLAQPSVFVTPVVVEAYKDNYKGGEAAWNRDFETYFRTYFPLQNDAGWMSSWFSTESEPTKDIQEYLVETQLTVGELNQYRSSDAKELQHYVKEQNISLADFRTLMELLKGVEASKLVQLTDTMPLFEVIKGAFVAEHSSRVINQAQ